MRMMKQNLLKNNYNYDAVEMNDSNENNIDNYKSIHTYKSIYSFSNQLHRNDVEQIYGGKLVISNF